MLRLVCLALVAIATCVKPNNNNNSSRTVLRCNHTVNISAGELLILSCTVRYDHNCTFANEIVRYNCPENNITDSYEVHDKFTRDAKDHYHFVFDIKGIEFNDTCVIDGLLKCDMGPDHHVVVNVFQPSTGHVHGRPSPPPPSSPPADPAVGPIIVGVLVLAAAAVGILSFLFGSERGRRITGCRRDVYQQGNPEPPNPE